MRQPNRAPPEAALRHTHPLSIERRDTAFDADEERQHGTSASKSISSRWAQWNRSEEAERPERVRQFDSAEECGVKDPASRHALEEELAETKAALGEYRQYVEENVLQEVALLEEKLRRAQKQSERYRAENALVSAKPSSSRDDRNGVLLYSDSESSVDHSEADDDEPVRGMGHPRRPSSHGALERKVQDNGHVISRLAEANAQKEEQLSKLERELDGIKLELNGHRRRNEGGRRTPLDSPMLAASNRGADGVDGVAPLSIVNPTVEKFLETIVNDGSQFAAALCRLGESSAPHRSGPVGKAAAQAFAALRASWQGTEEEVRAYVAVNERKRRHRTPGTPFLASSETAANMGTSADLPTLLSTITYAQSQEHLRLLDILQRLFQENASLEKALHKARGDVATLRETSALRAGEMEEDHQAEVELLQSTIRELEARVMAHTAASNSTAPHGGASRHHLVTGAPLPIASPTASAHTLAGNGSFAGLSLKEGRAGSTFSGSVASAPAGPGVVGDGLDSGGPMGEQVPGRRPAVDAETQTALSLEFIAAALSRNAPRAGDALGSTVGPGSPTGAALQTPLTAGPGAAGSAGDRGAFTRATRRERDMELVELLISEVESLRDELATLGAERNALQEQRDRFLCQVESPQLDYRRRLTLAGYLGNQTMPH